MKTRKTSVLVRLLAAFLVLATLLPLSVGATALDAVQPRASDYLNSYNAYIYPAGNGTIQVYFTVTGTNYMDTIGALRISVYESTDNINWTLKKSFISGNYSNMMGSNAIFHSGHVDYQGVVGRYYKANVGVWAGMNGQGDSRYFYTSTKKAT